MKMRGLAQQVYGINYAYIHRYGCGYLGIQMHLHM